MLHRTASKAGWLAAAATVALVGAPTAQGTSSAAQTGAQRSGAGTWSAAPRTPWGHPDLQGVWTNSTTTPLERPADLADKAVLTDEERRLRDAKVASQVSFDRAGALPGVGAYNEFWMERGALNHRTSLVIDPPDGKIPAMTAAGQAQRGVLFGVGSDLQLTERFRRTGADSMDYQFTVNAPGVFTRPWTVATPMARIDGPIYEYACHEGNYSVPNILTGARAQEK